MNSLNESVFTIVVNNDDKNQYCDTDFMDGEISGNRIEKKRLEEQIYEECKAIEVD